MKPIILLCLTLFSSIRAFADPLEMANLLRSAPQLALHYLERNRPQNATESWTRLELDLAAQLNRQQKILDLAAALPADSSPELQLKAAKLAVRAALKLNQPATARQYCLRLIWDGKLSDQELKAARLDLIESYSKSKDGQGAYLSMLRYQQDYGRPAAETATRFVQWLAEAKMDRQAIDWLPSIDELSAPSLTVRLRTGLISPAEAAASARKMLKKQPGIGYWRVLLESARISGDKAGEIEASEALLGLSQSEPLARLYLDYAVQHANELQLLLGDDAAWLDAAAREAPQAAHAMLYHLAQQAADPQRREQAWLLFIAALQRDDKTATLFALFDDPEQIPNSARVQLGKIAFAAARYADAAKYWAAIALPDSLTQLDAADSFARAGRINEAAAMLQTLLANSPRLDPPTGARLLSISRLIAYSEPALAIVKRLADSVDVSQRPNALALEGELAAPIDPEAAAACYLQAALLSAPKDYFALDARQRAAELLAAAGLVNDARAQYRYLIEHTRDPARQSFLRGRLAQLTP